MQPEELKQVLICAFCGGTEAVDAWKVCNACWERMLDNDTWDEDDERWTHSSR